MRVRYDQFIEPILRYLATTSEGAQRVPPMKPLLMGSTCRKHSAKS
jgi:hypothetical protein